MASTLTYEQAVQLAKERGIPIPNAAPSAPTNNSGLSYEQALALAKQRGIPIPQQSQQQIPQQNGFLNFNPQASMGQERQRLSGISQQERQLAANPLRSAKVAGASVLNTAQGLANLVGKGTHYGTLGLSPEPKMNVDYRKVLGVGDQKPGDALLELAPLLGAPELLPTKGMGALGRLLTKGTEGAIWNKSAGGDASTGFALGAVPGALGSSLKAAGRNIKNPIIENLARMGAKTTNPEDLISASRSAGDLPVNIGKVINNPQVNKLYENRLAEVPGAGVAETQNSLAETVENRGKDLLESLKPSDMTDDPQAYARDAVLEAQEDQRVIKKDFYDKEDAIAQKEGFELDLNDFKKEGGDFLNLIKSQPFLVADPTIRSFVATLEPYLQGGKAPSIVAVRMAKDRLLHAARTFGGSSNAADRWVGPQFEYYANLLGMNTNKDITSKGSARLQEATRVANKNYAENFAPFVDPNIVKHLNKYEDASGFAQKIISPNKKRDPHENITRIMNLLPEGKKNSLPYAYLEHAINAEDEFGAKSFTQAIRALGKRQFKALFPDPKLQQQVLDYGRLRGMSEEALNLMYNPKTGQRNLSSWSYLMNAIKSGAEKGGAIGGPVLGKPVGAAVGAITAPLGLIAGSTGLAKAFTNPETRDKVVQRILEKQKAAAAPKKATQAEKLAAKYGPRILAAQNERNQNGARQ